MIAFAKTVAAEYRDEGVRCNAILPSVIDTPANRAGAARCRPLALGSAGRDRRVVLFLCSDESAATSGAAVPVYGRA